MHPSHTMRAHLLCTSPSAPSAVVCRDGFGLLLVELFTQARSIADLEVTIADLQRQLDGAKDENDGTHATYNDLLMKHDVYRRMKELYGNANGRPHAIVDTLSV